MQVITLEEFGDKKFETVLADLAENNTDRNARWFPILLENYRSYKNWYFLMDDDILAAFATVQEFYPGCYRVLTRTFIFPEYRRATLPKNDDFYSPSMRLVQRQLQDYTEYHTLFVSMENVRRRQSMVNFRNKMELATGLDWHVHPHMIKTCQRDHLDCWQNVCYTGRSLRLNSISIEEWKKRYGKQ